MWKIDSKRSGSRKIVCFHNRHVIWRYQLTAQKRFRNAKRGVMNFFIVIRVIGEISYCYNIAIFKE